MFQPKPPKSEQLEKTDFTLYYNHDVPLKDRKETDDYHQMAFIDPGNKNYAIRIERYNYATEKIIPIAFEKIAPVEFTVEDKVTIVKTLGNISKLLDKYLPYLKGCHLVGIERQLPHNYKSTRVALHTLSYMLEKLRNNSKLTLIYEVNSKLKGRILGAPKGLTDKQLKTWAIEVAQKDLEEREDTWSLEVIEYYTKKDDLSDCVVSSKAIRIVLGIQKKCLNKITDI